MNGRQSKATADNALRLWTKLRPDVRRRFENYPDGSYYVFPYKRFRRFVRKVELNLGRRAEMPDVIRALLPGRAVMERIQAEEEQRAKRERRAAKKTAQVGE